MCPRQRINILARQTYDATARAPLDEKGPAAAHGVDQHGRPRAAEHGPGSDGLEALGGAQPPLRSSAGAGAGTGTTRRDSHITSLTATTE